MNKIPRAHIDAILETEKSEAAGNMQYYTQKETKKIMSKHLKDVTTKTKSNNYINKTKMLIQKAAEISATFCVIFQIALYLALLYYNT